MEQNRLNFSKEKAPEPGNTARSVLWVAEGEWVSPQLCCVALSSWVAPPGDLTAAERGASPRPLPQDHLQPDCPTLCPAPIHAEELCLAHGSLHEPLWEWTRHSTGSAPCSFTLAGTRQ